MNADHAKLDSAGPLGTGHMILALEIGAAIVAALVAAVVLISRSRTRHIANRADPLAAKQIIKKKKKTSDTQAFRKWATGDIDHDKYREILDKNAKEGG